MERSTPNSSPSLLTSGRRLKQKSPSGNSTAQQPNPASPASFRPCRPSAGNNIKVFARKLDPRAFSSTPVERTNSTLDLGGPGWGNTFSHSPWLAWWHQPSDMKCLEDARDSELLGEVRDHSVAHLEDTATLHVRTCPEMHNSEDEDAASLPQQDPWGTAQAHRDGQALDRNSKPPQKQAMDTYNDLVNTLKCHGNATNRPKSQKPGGLGKSAKEVAVLPVPPRQAGSAMAGQPGASKKDLLGTARWPEDVTALAVAAEDAAALTVAAGGHPRRSFLSSHCQRQAEADCQELIGALHQNADIADRWPARSHQLGEFDRVAKETAAAVAAAPAGVLPPMHLPERLPMPESGLAELPGAAARSGHLAGHLLKEGSGRSSKTEDLPGVVRTASSGLSRSPEEGRARKTRLPGDLATVVPTANHCISPPPTQHPDAERGGAAHSLAAASAAIAGAAAAKDPSQGRSLNALRTWSMSSAQSSSGSLSYSKGLEKPKHTPRPSERSWAISSAAAAISRGARMSVSSDSDTLAVRLKREEELLDEGGSSVTDLAAELVASPGSNGSKESTPMGHEVQSAGSPLFLRLCGILPLAKGQLGMGYRCGALLLAVWPVFTFGVDLCRAQSRAAGPAGCPEGVCFHSLNSLVLAVGSFLGLLAASRLNSLELLGGPTTLLVRYAAERGVVCRWSSITSWQSLYLAVSWVSSLALRAIAMVPGSSPQDTARALSFAVSSLVFMGLIFGILYVTSLVCILIDSYVRSVRETMDPVRCIHEWDKLVALLRRVSRALYTSFLIVQFTAGGMTLCSFSGIMLQGGQQTWWFVSDMLLAQSLILIFFKTADITEMCKRMPSLINSLDFDGDNFSPTRHYLVEHISYSAAGFYVGEVRLTAAMALKLLYVSILAAISIFTRQSTA